MSHPFYTIFPVTLPSALTFTHIYLSSSTENKCEQKVKALKEIFQNDEYHRKVKQHMIKFKVNLLNNNFATGKHSLFIHYVFRILTNFVLDVYLQEKQVQESLVVQFHVIQLQKQLYNH